LEVDDVSIGYTLYPSYVAMISLVHNGTKWSSIKCVIKVCEIGYNYLVFLDYDLQSAVNPHI